MKRSAIRVPFEGKFPGKVQVCRQCSNARCVKVCPEKALERDRQSIRLDRSRCSGCGMCVEACPFNAIYLDPVDGLAVKCDLCNGKFMCVEYCQKQAIKVIK
jgi:carbon-monoxide dehydrogenase iron sulfur subunit